MLSPEQLKGYADIAVSLLGAGGFGAIILAIIGFKKSATEKHPEPVPSIGQTGMANLAGMMVGEHFGMELLRVLRELSECVKGLTQAHEHAARGMREASEDRRNDIRRLCEEIDSLTDATRDRRPGH